MVPSEANAALLALKIYADRNGLHSNMRKSKTSNSFYLKISDDRESIIVRASDHSQVIHSADGMADIDLLNKVERTGIVIRAIDNSKNIGLRKSLSNELKKLGGRKYVTNTK